MTAADLQQLDEALTAAGHDPECAAFEPGKECSCGVGMAGIPRVGVRIADVLGVLIDPAYNAPTVTLTGDSARLHQSMIAAGKRARDAQAAAQSADAEFRAELAAYLEACTR